MMPYRINPATNPDFFSKIFYCFNVGNSLHKYFIARPIGSRGLSCGISVFKTLYILTYYNEPYSIYQAELQIKEQDFNDNCSFISLRSLIINFSWPKRVFYRLAVLKPIWLKLPAKFFLFESQKLKPRHSQNKSIQLSLN